MGFRVRVDPVAIWRKDRWETNITLVHGIGVMERFAVAFGDTKEISTMRAELMATAINKGARPNEEATD